MATDSPRFLLFLPPLPTSSPFSAIKAAFGETVGQVLKEAASHASESSKASILEIALACSELVDLRDTSRSQLYQTTQSWIAAVYKLICVIAAQEQIDIEDAQGVDVRLILVAWSPDSKTSIRSHISTYGPVITLETLARSSRAWQYAFGVESDAGASMVQAFVQAKGSVEQISSLDSRTVIEGEESLSASAIRPADSENVTRQSAQTHRHVAVGGTFDHLHIGHKLLLAMTIFAVDSAINEHDKNERSATIGITGDQLLKNKKHADVLESWDRRQKAVQDFVDSMVNFTSEPPTVKTRNDDGPNGKSVDLHYPNGLVIKCTEIQDPFGPTITDEQISALIISGETRSGGEAVNDKREEKGWNELEVFEVDVLDADEGGEVKEGFQSKISSTAIREKIAKQTQTPC